MRYERDISMFCRSVHALVFNINSSDTDSLKMRYITNFFERIFRRGYSQIGTDNMLDALSKEADNIILFRDKQMYALIAYYLSDKSDRWMPERIDVPLHYEYPGLAINEDLKSKNIFVCDEIFQ